MFWTAALAGRLALIAIVFAFVGCADRPLEQQDPRIEGRPTIASGPTAVPTRTPGIDYPDPVLTPGDILPASVEQICVSGYSKTVRAVTAATRKQVFVSYGIEPTTFGDHELDHLIPLAIGGSNEPANLWPEPGRTSLGYKDKDRLENALHSLVCSGRLELAQAQLEIATDWYAAYRKYVKRQ